MLKNYIYQYRLLPEVEQEIKLTKDIVITKQTINLFNSIHFEYKNIFSSKNLQLTLQKIRKNDKVILFENQYIYYHTYRILFFIYRYLLALDFYNSKKYKKKTYAKLKSSISEIEKKYHKERYEAFDEENAFVGDHKVKAVLFRYLLYDKEATDIFLNFYTLYPKHLLKFSDDDVMIKKILFKIIDHFMNTYIDSEDVILKSLAITLNGYLRVYMKFPAKYAINITQNILNDIFNYSFTATSADLMRNIYISGRLNELPIFKNAKKAKKLNHKLEKKFDTFFQRISKDLDIELNITAKEYFKEDPLKHFLHLQPMEFFQQIE